MRKIVASIIILILATTSTTIIGNSRAEAVPTPSVPQFNVASINQSSVEITIKNQQFTPMTVGNDQTLELAYYVRYKWRSYDYDWGTLAYGRVASDSEYTTITFTSGSGRFHIPDDGKLDFQVKAQLGYTYLVYAFIQPTGNFEFESLQESDWSNTQTINIIRTEPTATAKPSQPTPVITSTPTYGPNPTTTPTQTAFAPDLDWQTIALISLSVIVAVLVVMVAMLWHKVAAK